MSSKDCREAERERDRKRVFSVFSPFSVRVFLCVDWCFFPSRVIFESLIPTCSSTVKSYSSSTARLGDDIRCLKIKFQQKKILKHNEM